MRILGNSILLDGNELATAIDAYLVAHNICVVGPRTVFVIDEGEDKRIMARDASVDVYVDPSGRIVDNRDTLAEQLARREMDRRR